ncbi:DUF4139 domain-containing protein [Terasakiella sp. SH-1]|uniref:DUF4139 domain-containing protein n=1 Tax=Terasakiella sp. SH-1 TaxID=2560057 RepID=UPI0010741559|nr:DUF4139 domain-containing protein [Terasakiella sp. SH-1]
MSCLTPLSFGLAACLFVTAAQAESPLDPPHQKELSLTLYQNGLGFVQDRRQVRLGTGSQTLAFAKISPQLLPDSLLIFGTGFNVMERRFAFDLLTPQALLEKSVGKTVSFRRFNSVTGKDDIIRAKILSAQGQVILERDGKIEVGLPGQLMIDKLPEGLRPHPTLLATLNSTEKQQADLALAYLSNGLKWHTSYSAVLDPKKDKLQLNAWANLTNNTAVSYEKADITLAAGQVNKQSLRKDVPMMARAAQPQAMMAMDSVMERTAKPAQALGGLHLFKLPVKTTLHSQETKQVQLLPVQNFTTQRILTQKFGPTYRALAGKTKAHHPHIKIRFQNNSAHPLPSGIVRLYRQDTEGQLHFIGEDRLGDTPKGTKAALHPSQSFDVTLKRAQTDFELHGKHSFEAAYKVTIKNAKNVKETVEITESIPGEWSLENSSHKPKSRENNQAVWAIDVPAQSEQVLTYRLKVRTR